MPNLANLPANLPAKFVGLKECVLFLPLPAEWESAWLPCPVPPDLLGACVAPAKWLNIEKSMASTLKGNNEFQEIIDEWFIVPIRFHGFSVLFAMPLP